MAVDLGMGVFIANVELIEDKKGISPAATPQVIGPDFDEAGWCSCKSPYLEMGLGARGEGG